jgi:hypothetical protein
MDIVRYADLEQRLECIVTVNLDLDLVCERRERVDEAFRHCVDHYREVREGSVVDVLCFWSGN